METWNQNTCHLMVLSLISLFVVVLSLFPLILGRLPSLIILFSCKGRKLFFPPPASQLFLLSVCFCMVLHTHPGVAHSDSAVLQNVSGLKLLFKHQMR